MNVLLVTVSSAEIKQIRKARFIGFQQCTMLYLASFFPANQSAFTYKDVFIRYWVWMLGVAMLGIGYFAIAFDKDKQGWNDKAAKTFVVKL